MVGAVCPNPLAKTTLPDELHVLVLQRTRVIIHPRSNNAVLVRTQRHMPTRYPKSPTPVPSALLADEKGEKEGRRKVTVLRNQRPRPDAVL